MPRSWLWVIADDQPRDDRREENIVSTGSIIRVTVAALWLTSAQSEASGNDPSATSLRGPTLEEVIVTARRREERMQDVPISASVFSAVDLERLQLDNVGALQRGAPNLTLTPYPGTQTRANVALRGQLEPDLFPTLDPAVGLYLDDVYVARMAGANLDLVDMERVEVLRGPQGTLFGRNTIGGAINLIPARPASEFAGRFTIGAGNYDLRELTAMLNVPLAGKAYSLRVAASHTEHDGYGRNVLLGRDLNADNREFARIQLRLAPADSWDLNLAFDTTHIDTPRDLVTLLAASAPNTLIPAARGNPGDRLSNYENPLAHRVPANRAATTDSEVGGASGTLTMDFARYTLKAIASYRKLKSNDRDLDLDGTPYDLFTIFERDERQHQFSGELQAFGDLLGNRLAWIGGLYYFDENGTFAQRIGAIAPQTLSEVINLPRGTADNESMAAYLQLSYAITPEFRITAGARYNRDVRQLTSRNARILSGAETCTLAANLLDVPGVCQATLPASTFRYVPYTFGVEFKPSDLLMLYAKLSRGYRAGGYNMRGTTEINLDTFGPEQVSAYEVGMHADLHDWPLRLNLALYHSRFEDIQVLQRAPNPESGLPLPLIANGGSARINGGELEVTALMGSVRLAGTAGVTEAKFTDLDARVFNLTLGSRFLQTPEVTASVAADLPLRPAFAEINLHVDYSWRDDVAFQYDPRSLARQAAYGLLNTTITVKLDRSNFELRMWVRNVLDTHYLLRSTDSVGLVNGLPGDPRTYGAALSYRLGAERR